MSSSTHTWTLPATPERASSARREVVAHVQEQGVDGPVIDSLRLAVAEALANAVVHAYVGVEPGTITVTVTIEQEAGTMHVVVADDGSGMVPRIDSPGLGVGMPLMATLTSSVDVVAPAHGTGTEVTMTFELAAEAPVFAGGR